MFKKFVVLSMSLATAFSLAACGHKANDSSDKNVESSSKQVKKDIATKTSSKKESSSSSSQSSSASSKKITATSKSVTPLTFEEALRILRRTTYESSVDPSYTMPTLISKSNNELRLKSYPGAKGLGFFTLTLINNNTVKIKAQIGSAVDEQFSEHPEKYPSEYLTVQR